MVGAGAHRPAADRERAAARTSPTTTASAYLDFSSQLVNVNIGYQHPKLVAAIQEYAGPDDDDPAVVRQRRAVSEAARLITELAPGDLNRVFFTNGGAEATENAMRMARLHTGRHKVLAAYRSYHGATAGAITMTGDPRRWGAEPAHARHRALLGSVPVPLGVPRDARPRRRPSARCSTCAT